LEEQLSAKEAWRAELCKMFPESNLEAERQKLFAEAEERRALHQKFNGNLVRELTGLEGKELGNFLSSFKAEFESPKAHEEWYVVFTHTKKLRHTVLPNTLLSLVAIIASGPILVLLVTATGNVWLSKIVILGLTAILTYTIRKLVIFH
jgi:hypothetical protein